jgi:hypothetical protein
MMSRAVWISCLMLAALGGLASDPFAAYGVQKQKKDTKPAPPAQKADVSKMDLYDLHLEVKALLTLHALEFTPAQLQTLQRVAKELPAQKRPKQPAKGSEAFRQVLVELRQALLAEENERVDVLEEKMEKIKDNEDAIFDEEVAITEAARRRVPEVMRLLTIKQLIAYVNDQGEELTDPLERIQEAIADGRALTGEEWKEARDEASRDVGQLVAGIDAERARKVQERVAKLLDRAHALKETALRQRQAELNKEARQIIGDISAMEVLRHGLEVYLARLLSNPRLGTAIEARLKEKAN